MELVTPSLAYAAAFARFYADFAQHDAENAEYYRPEIMNFPAYVQQLNDEALGINLPAGYVPCSHFWLRDTEQSLIGAIRVRHHIDNPFLAREAGHIGYDIAPAWRRLGYGTVMLRLVLPLAAELGIARALLVADEDNVASRRVIEANGGEFESIVAGQVYPNPLARYWIDCRP